MIVHQNSSLPKESFTDTVRRLAGAQKPPAKGSPAYSRFINRKIGRVIAAAAYQLGLTPNQVTYISAGFSTASIAAIALAQPYWCGRHPHRSRIAGRVRIRFGRRPTRTTTRRRYAGRRVARSCGRQHQDHRFASRSADRLVSPTTTSPTSSCY